MGKYIKNGLAYIRGIEIKTLSFLNKQRKYGSKIRAFLSASLDFDRKASVKIGSGTKIRERAVISVRNGAALEIGKNASVGMDNKIVAHDRIVIGDGTLLSPNVLIYDHDHIFDNQVGVHRKEFKSKSIVIGKNCWIGANTVILKGTRIGDNCIVGAGCVIKGEYPANSTIIQKREDTIIKRIK